MTVATLLIRLSALLVPSYARAEWREMWLAELAALRADDDGRASTWSLVAFSLGAPRHALIEALDGWTVSGTGADVQYAVRRLMARPGFAVTAILTLALGIGANALVFSAVRGVLLNPLPYPKPAQLVNVWQTQPGQPVRAVAPANFLDWRGASSFSGLAAYSVRRRSLTGGESERVNVGTVSANLFDILGVQPSVGRGFGPTPGDGGLREVLLREDLWTRRFARDTRILGRSIRLDDESVIVTGVIPVHLAFPEEAELWIQARHDVPEVGIGFTSDVRRMRDARYLGVVGRIADGVSLPQAQAEMDAVAGRLRQAYPDENADTGINIVDLQSQITGASAPMLWILLAVVGAVLALACANVATLLLASAITRGRELAVRAALGASRPRLVRQLMIESAILGLAGAGVGLLLAVAGRPALLALIADTTPRLASIAIDGSIVLFTIGLGLLTATAFGVAPALVVSRASQMTRLRDGGRSGASRGGTRAASILVAAQLAIALTLVTGTGLMLRTMWTLYRQDPGIDIERVLALDVTIPDGRTPGRAASAAAFDRMVERLASLPGVTAAGAIQALPLATQGPSANIRVTGRSFPANEAPDVAWRTITPDYFTTMGARLVRGRAFTAADREGAPPVAIINETLARLLWGDSDPLGVRIGTGLDGDGSPVEIVGIVSDIRQDAIGKPARPEMYRPLAQPSRFAADVMTLVLRTDAEPASLARAAREAIREIHSIAPVAPIRPMTQVAARGVARERSAMIVLATFGALALGLAAIGLHGVLARLVGDRARELGVRIALGAEPSRVRRLVLARTMKLAGAGVVAGGIGLLALARQLESLLHGAPAADPRVFAGAATVLLAAALLASYLPARRASRIDPLIVMRSE
jgi:putative ABC transport system permease protein